MKIKVETSRENPIKGANFFSKLFFGWTFEIFKKGAEGSLEISDIYRPLKSNESEYLCNKLEREWNLELEKSKIRIQKGNEEKLAKIRKKPSLSRALIRTFFWENVGVGIILIIQDLCRAFAPLFQEKVINHFDVNSPQKEALYNATILSVIVVAVVFTWQHYYFKTQEIGMRMRISCTSLIYKKLFRIKKSSLNQTARGQVMNLLGTDVNRFDYLVTYFHTIYSTIIQFFIISYFVWNIAGYASVVGIAFTLIISTPSNMLIAKFSKVIRIKTAALTDERIQFTNELISGIQAIKMYAWETPFGAMISKTRMAEMKQIKLASYLKAFYSGNTVIMEKLLLFVVMVSYSLMGGKLSGNFTFGLATFFNVLQISISFRLSQCFLILGEALISIKRIEDFLLLEEIDQSRLEMRAAKNPDDSETKRENDEFSENPKTDGSKNALEVKLEHVYATWVPGQLPPTLSDISLKIEGGELCGISGIVGSGKTAILQILLRELQIGSGLVSLGNEWRNKSDQANFKTGYIVDGSDFSISYASQDAWLFSGTVRDNILFGQEYDEERYKKVTQVCALHRDFQKFPYGDMSIVGERGMSLSGGQRARINLARAVYKEAKIYLLDDPLSAVDTHVSEHLFQKCVMEFLANKTRLLVTHQLQFLERVDKVVFLDHGKLIYQGNYGNFINSNINAYKMLKEKQQQKDDNSTTNNMKRTSIFRRVSRHDSRRFSIIEYEDCGSSMYTEQETNEHLEQGTMKLETLRKYFRTGNRWPFLLVSLICLVMAQIFNSLNDYWTSVWTNADFMKSQVQKGSISKNDYQISINDSLLKNLGFDENGFLIESSFIDIYTILICAVVITNYLHSTFFINICSNTSAKLHDAMFENVALSPMLFFNTNPSGRILNRFSKDMGIIDEMLPRFFLAALSITFVTIGVLCLIAIVNYWTLIPILVIGVVIFLARKWCLGTISVLKRYEGITKSPIFSHVNATLLGLPTVRSGGTKIEAMMTQLLDHFQDVHTGADYLVRATASTFCLLVDLLCAIFLACVTLTSIFVATDSNGEKSSGSSVGLAISQALIMCGLLQFGVWQSIEVVMQMTAVERVLEYTKLPRESIGKIFEPVPPNWPSKGKIILKNVSMKYAIDKPLVLKNLYLTIEPGWKIGVVGRTGAGKSSLISALFRLTNENLEGNIEIDERDTAKVSLSDLRSRLSIIPQEPVLFSKSLRYNLDPFGKYLDSELLEALKEVEMNDYSLDQRVGEGGSNFSVGQRQLICLARVILKNNKMLVLDEATANIDNHTDALIQRTIRKKFAHCTVLTIAHRLNTIIDSDRVIVMDDGHVVEYDSPYKLLCNKPDGHFSRMVKNSGPATADELMTLAESAHSQSTNNGDETKSHQQNSNL